MLNSQLQSLNSYPSFFLSPKPSILFHGFSSLPVHPCQHLLKRNTKFCLRANYNVGAKTGSSSMATSIDQTPVTVKAVVTVKVTTGEFFSNLGLTKPVDDFTDLFGKTLLLELISAELDHNTGLERETIKAYAHRVSHKSDEVKYESSFAVPASFGKVGAIVLENEHHKEMYLNNIVLEGFPNGPLHFTCNSWVHSKYDNPHKRIFFTNKSFLPSDTPSGLKRLRELELENLRGTGEGKRKTFERIYDYDTYNDLGDPDKSSELARPVLGGKDHPFPRRCRTGRPRCKKDPLSEQRSSSVYVPRDEAFSEVKQLTFSAKTLKSVMHALLPQLEISLLDPHLGFPHFTAIDLLFCEGLTLPKPTNAGFFQSILPTLVKAVTDTQENLLPFETPAFIDRDKFAWFRDEEFSRQTLAGLNPCSIQLVMDWPMKSKLNPKIYGPPKTLITTELVEQEIGGIMTVNEALKSKRLFVLDYHDLLLPYVNKVREVEGTTLYGSMALFFLTKDDTLRPVAIELTRPPTGDKPQWK